MLNLFSGMNIIIGKRERKLRAGSRSLHYERCEDKNLLAIVVDSSQDIVDLNDGQTTLREAIEQANVALGPDTITFAPSVTGTIDLNSQLPTIEEALTITGPGPDQLAIDGSGTFFSDSILRIDDNSAFTTQEVTITGLTFQNAQNSAITSR